MKKRILRYLKHLSFTLLVVVPTLFLLGILTLGAGISYNDNPQKMNWDNEGPYVFYKNDSILEVNYIKGNQKDGFYVTQKEYSKKATIPATSHFALDSTSFSFPINTNIKVPGAIYKDNEKIFAVSDIESGYKTFREILINSDIIDQNLNWTFGRGHLVLVGDFVDRGFSTTQVLWFIYKLEQDAKKHGGTVHFILGNHELKNLQGNYESAAPKYTFVSAILGKQQYELYNSNSFIGKWLESKNTIELINGHLFVHGGIHPDIANTNLNLDQINSIIRGKYRSIYYPKREKNIEQQLISSHIGPSWYRGYFRDNLTIEEIQLGLDKFNAKDVIVGHTIQKKVNRQFDGKVIGIDVRHPKDYHKTWPSKKSEALLIENDNYYRVLSNGKKKGL